MPQRRRTAPPRPPVAVFLALLAAACSSSSSESGSGGSPPGTGGGDFSLVSVQNGFGPLLPHRVIEEDINGMPTGGIVLLRTVDDIVSHVRPDRPILPPTTFLTQAQLPNGAAGNQFMVARFSDDVLASVVLSGAIDAPVRLETVDQIGTITTSQARLFVGGVTNVGGNLVRWVDEDPATGQLRALVPEAAGFPGVASPFAGMLALIQTEAVTIVADLDGDLSTFEVFGPHPTIRLVIEPTIGSTGGTLLMQRAVATSHVGVDNVGAEVRIVGSEPLIVPGNGMVDVDPASSVEIEFVESVQPYAVGGLTAPSVSPGIQLVNGISAYETSLPFTARPVSAYDLTRYALTPASPFPGLSPSGSQPNPGLAIVNVHVSAPFIHDLASPPNANTVDEFSYFIVGQGSGLTNTPVMPDAIYVTRSGALPGLSVIDLNGFGQSTGSPVVSNLTFPAKGDSRWYFNPNRTHLGLFPGTSSIDGGSAGIFTLTLDSNLDDLLAIAPILTDASDMHVGHPLDTVFRNAPAPFGCQSGGGNVCALDGLHTGLIDTTQGAFGTPASIVAGDPHSNLISYAPHPNPPKITFPSLCASPHIGGEEPTSIDLIAMGNLLQPGDPFGDLATMTPPSGLLREQNAVFGGPSVGQTQPQNCTPYLIRQQIGNFLYVIDRNRSEVVVLNSNRMTVIDRIFLADPTSLAMDPNLRVLAVSLRATNSVAAIDINPASATFHTVTQVTPVGPSPSGLAYEPLGEDLFVCNEGNDTISIIDPLTFTVRKTVPSLVSGPFEVAVTPRMTDFSFSRDVYFAYILGRDGQVAVFESGPDGPGGIGYDTTIGTLPFLFQEPKAIQLDPLRLDASVFIAYEGPINVATGMPGAIGEGAISRLNLESALAGALPLVPQSAPGFRDLNFAVTQTLAQSADQLTGIPVDIAFDDIQNDGHLVNPTSAFAAGTPVPFNGKSNYRRTALGAAYGVSAPAYMLAACPDADAVDVISIGITGAPRLDVDIYTPGVQSIVVPAVRGLAHYWRQ